MELIRARSPQAKGRVERSFGTAQDRWVKELRLANVKTCEQANVVLEKLVPDHNRRFAKAAQKPADAHRRLGPSHRLESILSIQTERVVSNDYVVRFANRFYQLLPPVHPGERGGRVMVEERLDGSLAIRFGMRYLPHREAPARSDATTSASERPEASSHRRTSSGDARPPSGRSEAPPNSAKPPLDKPAPSAKRPYRRDKNHPWNKPYK